MRRFLVLAALPFAMMSGQASATTVTLNSWVAESYPAVQGFSPGTWNVETGGTSVTQTINGQPTIFYSDFNAFGTETSGKIEVRTNSDDDFIGFVLGFDAGDTTNGAADYLLVDWKGGTQTFNFRGGTNDNTAGTTAPRGLAVSRVTGIPTADELWGHVNDAGDAGGGVQELQRGATLGSTGWQAGQIYDFTFDFGPNNLVVSVDGNQELSIAGSFENGRLGFYNFSQSTVKYSAFTVEDGTFVPPAVPLPASAILLLGGLGVFGAVGRARKRA